MPVQANLLAKYMDTAPQGLVEWIGIRTARKSEIRSIQSVFAIAEKGLEGDHASRRANGSARQVTLINQEDMTALTTLLGRASLEPELLRRNIVVSGLNLHAMRYQILLIGDAIIQLGAHCHPCSRMEKNLGKGALLSMYGRGGYCAKIIQSGDIKIGDTLRVTQLQRELF